MVVVIGEKEIEMWWRNSPRVIGVSIENEDAGP